MKKKALHKDFFIEIKKTYNRFISILLIVALGVAFFAGLRACRSDMELSADTYYDDMNFMDIRILSTLGLTKDDVEAIASVDGVLAVEPTYTKDVLLKLEDTEIVVKTYSMSESINQAYLSEGRLPENNNECLVDTLFLENTGYQIGDVIMIDEENVSDSEKFLKENTLTIVGSCMDPRYLSLSRGTSTIGNGKINSFIILPQDNFSMEVYPEVYVTVLGAKELMTYSDEYANLISDVSERLEGISKKQLDIRYETVVEQPMREVENGLSKLNDAKVKYQEEKRSAEEAILEAEEQLSDFEKTVKELRDTLEVKKNQLYAVSYSESDVNRLFAVQEAQISAQEEELAKQKEALEEKKTTSKEEFAKVEKDLQSKEEELLDAKAALLKISSPEWYILDRTKNESYVSYGSDAERMEAIAEVFPAFFFLVAALVCLTTMTRMVDEQRVQIGTLKALGYSKTSIASKYILYALLATLTGSILGVLVGQKVFPFIVIISYKIMYQNLPYIQYPYHLYYGVMASLLAILCTTLATYFACYKELRSQPATLMRPAAPKIGKRILLERIPFIWNHLNFTKKATLRNLFRYKKRLFMTIIGIAGCMALLLVGFGIKDSIGVMSEIQYEELWKQDAVISLKTDLKEEDKIRFLDELKTNKDIKKVALGLGVSTDISHGKTTKTATLIVLKDVDDFDDFYTFRDRIRKDSYHLSNDGVILSEKLANMLDVKAGDTITLKVDDFKEATVRVTAITENYIEHMIYMTSDLYNKMYGKTPDYNEILLINESREADFEENLFENLLSEHNEIFSISSTKLLQNRIDDMLRSLNIIVYVLIICAGLLAFIVLYNLSNININERKRELASLKVLGFYDGEVNSYVMRENIILTVIGIVLGMGLGVVLHRFVIITSEIELVMFGRLIKGISFFYSSMLTLIFSFLISFVMYFKLKKINMIESLKSVE